MKSADCAAFLQWALPRLGLRWAGFRKVRGQVCKRIQRRLAELGLGSLTDYRHYLAANPDEWAGLDRLCTITISRFFRDRGVFSSLEHRTLPDLAVAHRRLRVWSVGCASGEEPYSLAILWRLGLAPRFPRVTLEIMATERDARMRQRARRACYGGGSLREIPDPWRRQAFEAVNDEWCLRPVFREGVEIGGGDVRERAPEGRFQLILCRNLAFTYFDGHQQQAVLARLSEHLSSDGRLVIGSHERLPPPADGWREEARSIFYRS